jgi:hypothetical protein
VGQVRPEYAKPAGMRMNENRQITAWGRGYSTYVYCTMYNVQLRVEKEARAKVAMQNMSEK